MRKIPIVVVGLLAAGLVVGLADTVEIPEPGTKIPPVHRDSVYFEAGAQFLSSLPDGAKVQVSRRDGSQFELYVDGRKLMADVGKAALSEDETRLVTPFGYQIQAINHPVRQVIVYVTAPNGMKTEFRRRRNGLAAMETDGSLWQTEHEQVSLRLPDATRVDMIEQRLVWEVNALTGQRFRLDLRNPELKWETMAPIPSPPLIPDMQALYVSGDGDDWSRPAHEDHMVFAWSWFPYGLSLETAVEDLRDGHRRTDLRVFFNEMPQLQPPAELGGYLLARRLGLDGGDQVTFGLPDGTSQLVFVLPGSLPPDSYLPTPMPAMALPHINPPPKK